MRILLDECTPRVVKTQLARLTITTGWQGIENGDLLNRVEQGFDVLVTADRNLPRQQKLSGRRVAVVVLPSNQVPVVMRLLPDLERVLDTIQPGTLVEL